MSAMPRPWPFSMAICLVFSAVLPAFPQVSIGNRVGASMAQFTFSSTNANTTLLEELNGKTKALYGFAASVPVEIQFTDHFALQPELGYLLEGWTNRSANAQYQVRLNYGQVNVLAKVTMGRGPLRVFAQAGPCWNKLLSVRQLGRSPSTGITIADATVYKDMDPFEPMAWSVMAGGGLAFQRGGACLFIDYRYIHGVTRPMQDLPLLSEDGSTFGLFSAEVNAHLVTLGVLVPLKPAGAAPAVE